MNEKSGPTLNQACEKTMGDLVAENSTWKSLDACKDNSSFSDIKVTHQVVEFMQLYNVGDVVKLNTGKIGEIKSIFLHTSNEDGLEDEMIYAQLYYSFDSEEDTVATEPFTSNDVEKVYQEQE